MLKVCFCNWLYYKFIEMSLRLFCHTYLELLSVTRHHLLEHVEKTVYQKFLLDIYSLKNCFKSDLQAGRMDSGLDLQISGNQIQCFQKICDLVYSVILLNIFSVLSGKNQGSSSECFTRFYSSHGGAVADYVLTISNNVE